MLEEQLSLVDSIIKRNNEIDKSSNDLKYRKSRYSNMREILNEAKSNN